MSKIAPGVKVLGRYELLERLPDYGIGEVWQARDTGRGAAVVAVKLLRELPPGVDELPDALDRHFGALAGLPHGNVLRTIAHGLHERRPVVVHAHFKARSLAWGLRAEGEQRPSAELLERLHDRVAAALIAARDARDVAHGALDPRSVLVARVGPQNFELRVLDFGLAPHADWLHGGDQPHALAIRRPPELPRGAPATTSSEVFALGEFTRVLFGEAPEFRRPMAGVPRATWAVIQRATAAAPDDRHGSIEDFLEEFRAQWWATPTPDPAPPEEATVAQPLVDVDATVIQPPRARPGAPPRPTPPPVVRFPEQVLARPAPTPQAAPFEMPPLAAPSPPRPAVVVPEEGDTTVRLSHMAKRQSPWDEGAGSEPTVLYVRPPAESVAEPPVTPPAPPKPRQEVVPEPKRKPEPKPEEVPVSEDDLREERQLRWLLGVVAAAVVGLAALLVVVLTRG